MWLFLLQRKGQSRTNSVFPRQREPAAPGFPPLWALPRSGSRNRIFPASNKNRGRASGFGQESGHGPGPFHGPGHALFPSIFRDPDPASASSCVHTALTRMMDIENEPVRWDASLYRAIAPGAAAPARHGISEASRIRRRGARAIPAPHADPFPRWKNTCEGQGPLLQGPARPPHGSDLPSPYCSFEK